MTAGRVKCAQRATGVYRCTIDIPVPLLQSAPTAVLRAEAVERTDALHTQLDASTIMSHIGTSRLSDRTEADWLEVVGKKVVGTRSSLNSVPCSTWPLQVRGYKTNDVSAYVQLCETHTNAQKHTIGNGSLE